MYTYTICTYLHMCLILRLTWSLLKIVSAKPRRRRGRRETAQLETAALDTLSGRELVEEVLGFQGSVSRSSQPSLSD